MSCSGCKIQKKSRGAPWGANEGVIKPSLEGTNFLEKIRDMIDIYNTEYGTKYVIVDNSHGEDTKGNEVAGAADE